MGVGGDIVEAAEPGLFRVPVHRLPGCPTVARPVCAMPNLLTNSSNSNPIFIPLPHERIVH